MGALVFLFMMILALVRPAGLSAEQWLKGQVLHNQGTRSPKAMKGVVVSIVDVGNAYTTGDDGGYRVFLPDAIQFSPCQEEWLGNR